MKSNTFTTGTSIISEEIFAERVRNVPRSFIREILKVAIRKDIISFAGGLPNPALFPVDELSRSAIRVLKTAGREALQYSNTEGFLPLREYIAARYLAKQGLKISPENILITTGSQQALDLVGKVLLNRGDGVVIEEPGYLGAIQAFSLYEPDFVPVSLTQSGMDTEQLKKVLSCSQPKMLYTVPEFQNPSGISYDLLVRQNIAELVKGRDMLIIEDTPYTDIRFAGSPVKGFYDLLPEQTIRLGTFSKTVVPGFRLGWIVASRSVMEKLIIAKQAADLHTNTFVQQLLYNYLTECELDEHIGRITEVYGRQCRAMMEALEEYFPGNTEFTRPEGGMFLWVKLPGGISAMMLFQKALERNVTFVPGDPFYVGQKEYRSTLRLNFSCADEDTIREGIKRLAKSLRELVQEQAGDSAF